MSVGITSAWVWGAVFLQTGTLTYLYGVSIPWWFGMGGFVGRVLSQFNVTPQAETDDEAEIAAFAFISSKIKVNASGAST